MNTPLTLTKSKFYRNGLGQIVWMVSDVAPDHKLYAKGFRFIDQRGTYYRADGNVSDGVWASLNLTEEVSSEEGIDSIMAMIDAELQKSQKARNRAAKINLFAKRAMPVLAGMNLGIGAANLLLANYLMGSVNMGAGLFGLYQYKKILDEDFPS